jgi:Glycosyl hydrolase family 99
MKKSILLIAIYLLASCASPVPSMLTATRTLPTSTATLLSPTSTSTTVPSPTLTPPPPETVTYYRIRVEYVTTSDWSRLYLSAPEQVLSIRTIKVNGETTYFEAGVEQLGLNQLLSDAEKGKNVGVVVDYALTPETLDRSFKFWIEKGNIGNSTVSIFNMAGGTLELIKSFKHTGVVDNSGGRNPGYFKVDLDQLKDSSPIVKTIQGKSHEKMLWAFYYPWYSLNNWSSSWLKDHPLEPYASNNKAVIAKQIEQAQSAGIDAFISSWWGPQTDTDQNLGELLDIADEKNFKVTIYFETLAGPNGSPLDESQIRSWLAYAIERYRDHPAFMKVDGKPLIVIFVSGTVPLEAWARLFASLRDEGLDAVYLAMGYSLSSLDVFDGLHDYSVFTYPNLKQTDLSTARGIHYYPLLSDQHTPKIWVATVQPGYDDTLQPSREGQIQDRLNGDFYRSTWEAAIQSDPDWIFITTWNEWYEHTNIEPGELYGEQYLKITREYADQWKGK